jgi:hypothetical protein
VTHLQVFLIVLSLWAKLTSRRHVDLSAYTGARRLRLKCDGTRAETRFRFSAKRTIPFKSAGASVQSATGSRGVRISGSNAGYAMFGGSVKSTVYPLHSPFTSPPVRHRVPSHFNWTLQWAEALTALLSSTGTGFSPTPFCVAFAVDTVALGESSFPVSIIPLNPFIPVPQTLSNLSQ